MTLKYFSFQVSNKSIYFVRIFNGIGICNLSDDVCSYDDVTQSSADSKFTLTSYVVHVTHVVQIITQVVQLFVSAHLPKISWNSGVQRELDAALHEST